MFPTDWGRRCALVIQSSQVTDNEVNFPLLATEDTLPSEIFDADGSYPALNGGGDIRFSSDSAGNTQLACEIESFVTDNDPANGKAAIWVKVPSLSSSSNTTIYIWYNKAGESQPAETDAYGKHAVWDANFKMVQHMNQTPDGTAGEIVDSTSNNNDGTTSGMDSADQVAGQIDGSLDFDWVDDYVSVADVINDWTSGTISAWASADDSSPQLEIIYSGGGGTINRAYLAQHGAKWAIRLGASDYLDSTGANIITNQFYYITAIWDANSHKIYEDGIETGSVGSAPSGQIGDSNTDRIGGLTTGSYLFDGTIDEVRISNTVRSAGWIATEYNNQNAPGTFLIEGTPESPEAVGQPIMRRWGGIPGMQYGGRRSW